MESKKINQLATELTPSLSDLTIIGDPSTGISKKITLSQMASLFTGTVEEYPNLASFPLVGVADTIYIALDTNVLYRWDTTLTSYVELSPNIINSLVFNDANGFDGTISLVGSVATLTITTALTTGSVAFIGASGALLQDNANFFWDDTNNRLGLGTNAPTTAIDVFGSGIIGRLNGTSTNNAFLGFASAGSNKWSIGNVQSDHRFRIYSEANTSELISVLQTGEFGIGIANPTTKLHIDGGASALIANLDANVSVAKSISFRSDNSNRINLEVSETESGSNAGANFFLRTYTDAGALINTPLTIIRSTGAATFSNAVGIGATAGTNGLFEVSNLGTGVTVGDFLIDAANKNVYIGRLSSTSNDNTNFIVRNRVGTEAFKVTGNTGGISINGSIANSADTSLISIKQSSTSYTNGIYLERSGERNGYFMYVGGPVDSLTFRRNYFGTQSDVMSLTRDGKVGIGITEPADKLSISDSSVTMSLRYTNAGTVASPITSALYFRDFNSGGGNIRGGVVLQDQSFDTSGTNMFLRIMLNSGSLATAINMQRDGNVYNYNNSTTWQQFSDIKIKENIRPISNALDKINSLNPSHFEYKNNIGKIKTGFIAQEFEAIFPGHVSEKEPNEEFAKYFNEGEKMKSIDADLIPYLVKAIQELNLKLN